MVEEWLTRDQAGNRSHDYVKKLFNRLVLPAWGKRPIEEIRKADVNELIDEVKERGAIVALQTLRHIKRMLNWAAERDLIDSSPAAHVKGPKPGPKARDRKLSDAELAAVWHSADEMGWPFGPAVQLLILTGCRKMEVVGLGWSEVDLVDASIRLPAERSKNKVGRAVPLSGPAVTIFEGLPRLKGSDLVFTLNGRVPFGGLSERTAKLRAEVATLLGKEPAHWTLHDIRRTVATGLQKLGIRLEVTEDALGHVSGSRSGIVGIYQQHKFEAEVRAAVEAWGDHVAKIVEKAGQRKQPSERLQRLRSRLEKSDASAALDDSREATGDKAAGDGAVIEGVAL